MLSLLNYLCNATIAHCRPIVSKVKGFVTVADWSVVVSHNATTRDKLGLPYVERAILRAWRLNTDRTILKSSRRPFPALRPLARRGPCALERTAQGLGAHALRRRQAGMPRHRQACRRTGCGRSSRRCPAPEAARMARADALSSRCGWCSATRRSIRACAGSPPRCSTCARSMPCAPSVETHHRVAARSAAGTRANSTSSPSSPDPLPALVIMDMLGVPREELPRLKRLSDEMALFIGSARDAPDKYERAEAATARDGGAVPRSRSSRAAARPAARPADRAGPAGRPGRPADRRRARRDLRAAALRRARDHHAPHRQRPARAARASRRSSRGCASGRPSPPAAVEELLRYDGPIGAQVRIVQQPQAVHGKRVQARRACVPADERRQPRSARVRGPRIASTCSAMACRTSPSASARTSASAFRSPGWRARSPCRRCSRAGRRSSSPRRGWNGSTRWCCAA